MEIANVTLKEIVDCLMDSNDALRTAYAVASRRGEATNWEGYAERIEISLKRQHEILWPQQAGYEKQMQREKRLEEALNDCLSVFRDDTKTATVTAERLEAWRSKLL